MRTPLVSVVMSVYNSEAYLNAAVQSILNQTYHNFEFIIINDYSTDSSGQILHSYQDKRIHIIENTQNMKLAASLNKGIAAAAGKYIIRMDSDDIAFPRRIEKQVAYMERHSGAVMAYCDMIRFSGTKIIFDCNTNDLSPNGIHTTLFFYNVINHNAVIIRRECFSTYSYQPEYTVTEDLALWVQLSKDQNIHYMHENLMLYRIHGNQAGIAKHQLQLSEEQAIKEPLLNELLGNCGKNIHLLHGRVCARNAAVSEKTLSAWLHFLQNKNNKSLKYSSFYFTQMLLRLYFVLSIKNHYSPFYSIIGLFRFGPASCLHFLCKIVLSAVEDFFWFLKGIPEAKKLIFHWR